MSGNLHAKIIMARCAKTNKTYGIRVEQRDNDWVRTWAFPIDENKAKREGFDVNTISGSLRADPDFPGCPHCKALGFVVCQCGKMGCNGGLVQKEEGAEYQCPWCNQRGIIVIADNFNVSGEGY